MPREAQFRSPKHIFYPFGGPWARDPKNWKRNTAVAVAVYGTALYCFASYADRYAKVRFLSMLLFYAPNPSRCAPFFFSVLLLTFPFSLRFRHGRHGTDWLPSHLSHSLMLFEDL